MHHASRQLMSLPPAAIPSVCDPTINRHRTDIYIQIILDLINN